MTQSCSVWFWLFMLMMAVNDGGRAAPHHPHTSSLPRDCVSLFNADDFRRDLSAGISERKGPYRNCGSVFIWSGNAAGIAFKLIYTLHCGSKWLLQRNSSHKNLATDFVLNVYLRMRSFKIVGKRNLLSLAGGLQRDVRKIFPRVLRKFVKNWNLESCNAERTNGECIDIDRRAPLGAKMQ